MQSFVRTATGTLLSRGRTTERRLVSGDSLGSAGMPTTVYEDMQPRVLEAMQMLNKEDEVKRWFSRSHAVELLKGQDIEAVLLAMRIRKAKILSLKKFVHDDATLLFVMLIYLDKLELLEKFYNEGIGDAMFPLQVVLERTHAIIKGRKPVRIEFGNQIKYSEAHSLFDYHQWMFFVPRLRWTAFEHATLQADCRLPFLTRLETQSSTEFSTVYKTVIHKDHVVMDSGGIEIATDAKGHPYVAVKKLLPTGLTDAAFTSFVKAEYETLDMLRGLDTRHLIKAAAFYKQNGSLFFIFPWAQHGNLRRFWREKIPLIGQKSYMKWVFAQLLGMADAIRTLHHANNGRTCRHGDLKPENILCFNALTSSTAVKDHTSCILVISDVGLARTHDKSTHLRSKTKMIGGETIAYAPPETELHPDSATSRRYDIWSLGCLYLEFVIWLLYGIEGLERFRKETKGKIYTLTNHADRLQVGGTSVKLNPEVDQWIESIKQDPRCASVGTKKTAMFRLVSLVKERFLVPVTNSHPTPGNAMSISRDSEEVNQGSIPNSQQRSDAPTIQISLQETTVTTPLDFQNAGFFQASGLPDAGKAERAFAPEVCQELAAIIREVENGIAEWINIDRDSPKLNTHIGIEPVTSGSTVSTQGSRGKNDEYVR